MFLAGFFLLLAVLLWFQLFFAALAIPFSFLSKLQQPSGSLCSVENVSLAGIYMGLRITAPPLPSLSRWTCL